jgi:hypothetical protein
MMSLKIILRALGVVLWVGGSAAWAQRYVISTIAGGGPPATPIAAVDVSISFPGGVAVDAAGNVLLTSAAARHAPSTILNRQQLRITCIMS